MHVSIVDGNKDSRNNNSVNDGNNDECDDVVAHVSAHDGGVQTMRLSFYVDAHNYASSSSSNSSNSNDEDNDTRTRRVAAQLRHIAGVREARVCADVQRIDVTLTVDDEDDNNNSDAHADEGDKDNNNNTAPAATTRATTRMATALATVVQTLHTLGCRVRDAPQRQRRTTCAVHIADDADGGNDSVSVRVNEPLRTQQQDDSDDVAAATATPTTTCVLIEGMTCSSCAARIEQALQRLTGMHSISVSFATLSGRATHDAQRLPVAQLLRAINKMGYRATLQYTTAATAAAVAAAAPSKRRGASSSLSHKHARDAPVQLCSDDDDDDDDDDVNEDKGDDKAQRAVAIVPTATHTQDSKQHDVVEDDDEDDDDAVAVATTTTTQQQQGADEAAAQSRMRNALERSNEIAQLRRSVLASTALSLPLIVAMLLMACTDVLQRHLPLNQMIDCVQLMTSSPIVFCFGQTFFVHAWRSARHGAATMDTLVALGVGVSYAYSACALLVSLLTQTHTMTYFDTAGLLTTFMLLGRLLEAQAKRQTSSALVELMSLVPPEATRLLRRRRRRRRCVQGAVEDGDDDNDTTTAREDGSNNNSSNDNNNNDNNNDDVVVEDVMVRVPSSSLAVGARVYVRAGDRVPVDGVVVRGVSDVDEQLLTGESVPRVVRAGCAVVGGALNLTGALVVRAERVGAATVLAGIVRIVHDAQSTKPAVQRVADRMAAYFVPCVLALAVVTLLVWLLLGAANAYPSSWLPHDTSHVAFAVSFFIATVVAACPCALGLATPTAIIVGTGVGARHGVLIKSGVALEAVRATTMVLLDKTGTLTRGQLRVVWQHVQSPHAADEHNTSCAQTTATPTEHSMSVRRVARLIAAVEACSSHPIAQAVCAALTTSSTSSLSYAGRHANNNNNNTDDDDDDDVVLHVASVTTRPGCGVEALVHVRRTMATAATGDDSEAVQTMHHVCIGSLSWMEEQQQRQQGQQRQQTQQHTHTAIVLPRDMAHAAAAQRARELTVIVAAVDGVACGVFALDDVVKPEARWVLAQLHARGLRTRLVTGDYRAVALRVARDVGVGGVAGDADVHAAVTPAGKAALVQSLQRAGHRVMFVGDGINDSAALAQADVGVALGAGTHVAVDAADVVLLRNSLVDLLNLHTLSAMTVRRIYGNFAWAFVYNTVMLPVANGMLYPLLRRQLPPVLAGVAMVLSSLSVLTSSLMLRLFVPLTDADAERGTMAMQTLH